MVKVFDYIDIEQGKYDYRNKSIVIFGREIGTFRDIVNLINWGANIIAVTDFSVTDIESFAGFKTINLKELELLSNIDIFIAYHDFGNKKEALYQISELVLNNVNVLCRGVVYGAGEYSEEAISRIRENADKIEYVCDFLCDEESKRVFRNLIEYRQTNNRHLVEEIYETKHKQYFPGEEILGKVKNEIMVDCGGYDGMTTVNFKEWAGGSYEKSYIFEADDTMFEICKELMRFKSIDNVDIIKKAVYSKTSQLKFDNSDFASGSGNISESGTCIVEATSIDEMLDGREVTFIKMDIEGSEMEALLGAEKTIQAFHPKLAISIYHKDEDLWEIPYYLKNKYPFYQFYIRHYTSLTTETILYAVDK